MRNFLVLALLAVGCAPNYYVKDVYDDGGGALLQEKCSFGADGTPNPYDCHVEAVSVAPVLPDQYRYSNIEEVPVIPPAPTPEIAVDRARYRAAARVLAARARVTAAAGRCEQARELAAQVATTDRATYATAVLGDAETVRCLAAVAAAP